MKVADLYIAVVLLLGIGSIGWLLHEKLASDEARLHRIERKLRIHSAMGMPQLAAIIRSDPELQEVYDVLRVQLREEKETHA